MNTFTARIAAALASVSVLAVPLAASAHHHDRVMSGPGYSYVSSNHHHRREVTISTPSGVFTTQQRGHHHMHENFVPTPAPATTYVAPAPAVQIQAPAPAVEVQTAAPSVWVR